MTQSILAEAEDLVSPICGPPGVARVAAIVLNWNRLEETAACCQSVRAQTHQELSLWVVDNGSDEHTSDELHRACPQATIVALPRNVGFAAGVNAGIGAARDNGDVDFIWLLNNDAVCRPETLARMLAVADGDHRIAAVGCSMLEGGEDTSPRLVQAGKRLRPPFFIPVTAQRETEIDYLCGACLLIRREALEAVGLLDEGFFFFFEDADWCFRARRQGWTLGVASGDLVRHAGSGTIGAMNRLKTAHYRAGYVRFLRKYARHPCWVATSVTGVRLLIDLLCGRRESVAGTLDGWQRGWLEKSAPFNREDVMSTGPDSTADEVNRSL